MRRFLFRSLFIISTGIMSGCCTDAPSKPAASATTHARMVEKTEQTHTCVMQSGGKDVLKLTLASDVNCTTKDGMLKIKAPVYDNEVWLVDGAKTVDEGINRIEKTIVGEFKDFKATTTTDLTIGGAPAKHLSGTGHEADDGDAGNADIVVFKVGDHVFIACAHDENLTSLMRAGLLTVVQTAQIP